MDRFNEALTDRIEAEAGDVFEENQAAIEEAADARARFRGAPSSLYTYGTVYDTIGYNVSGSMGSWLGDAIETGGLEATAISFEMALDNATAGGALEYRPGLVEVQSAAYAAAFREMAVKTAASIDDAIESNGRDAGYVTTEALTRSSEDLEFDENTVIKEGTRTVEPGGTLSIPVNDRIRMFSLSVRPAGDATGRVRLSDQRGGTLREERVRQRRSTDRIDWVVTDTSAGRWQLSVPSEAAGETTVELTAVVAQDAPDPRAALGVEQREYEVTPLGYFEDYDEALDGASVDEFSVEAIVNGTLLEDGEPAIDQLVVIHDDGLENQAYVSAIDSYLDAGGDLVVTDAGVALLGALEAGDTAEIDERDISQTELRFATIDEKGEGDLLKGVRSIESELWTTPTLGYASGDAPATLVDSRAFESAGGTVAATTGRDVIAGALDSITVIGSVLPPASQENLHPFGLNDYAATSLGQQLLRNALGHEQADAEQPAR
jgi:hypothetical protein